MFFIIFAGFLPTALGALFLTPPSNKWVREGEENVTLVCVASEKIRACSWNTPYGKTYPLQSGLVAEGGRLTHTAGDKDLECGVTIKVVEAKDEGRWRCNIGVVENAEVTTASGMANLSIAVSPEDISLEAPFNQPEVNVTAGQETAVKCIVERAKPAPKFSWTIDGIPFEAETRDEEIYVNVEGISTFTQTVHLLPLPQYNNKTLTCSISHPGLTKSVGVHTTLTVTGTDLLNLGSGALPPGAIVGIVIAVILAIAIATLLAMLYRGHFAKPVPTESSDKLEEGGEGEDKVKGEDKPEGDEVTQERETEPVKTTFSKKMADFLGKLRKTDKKNLDDTVAQEFEKVELNEEEGNNEEKQDAPEKQEKINLGGHVRNLIQRFQKKAGKESVELQESEDKEEEKKEETADKVEEKEETENKDDVQGDNKDDNSDQNEKKIGSETPV